MQEQFGNYPFDQQSITKIISIIKANPSAAKIVLQFPKQYLPEAFKLTIYLRNYWKDEENKL